MVCPHSKVLARAVATVVYSDTLCEAGLATSLDLAVDCVLQIASRPTWRAQRSMSSEEQSSCSELPTTRWGRCCCCCCCLFKLHHVGRKTKLLVHHHLLSLLSLPAKIPEEDVHPGHGLLHCTGYTHHHCLEGFQLKPLLTTTCALPLPPYLSKHLRWDIKKRSNQRLTPSLHVRCLNLWF